MADINFQDFLINNPDEVGLTVSQTSISFTDFVTREETLYFSRNEYNRNFVHKGEFNFSVLDTTSPQSLFFPVVFANADGDSTGWTSAAYLALQINGTSISLIANDGTTNFNSSPYVYTTSTTIYYNLTKDATALSCDLYSDSDRTVLITTLSILTYTEDTTYSKLTVASGGNNSTTGTITGSISNFSILPVTADITVNITGDDGSGTWYAVNDSGVVYGPFSSGLQALEKDDYTIYLGDLIGYYKEGTSVSAYSNTTFNLKYIAKGIVEPVINDSVFSHQLSKFKATLSTNIADTRQGTVSQITDRDSNADSAVSFSATADDAKVLITDDSLDVTGDFSVSFWLNVPALGSLLIAASQWDNGPTGVKKFIVGKSGGTDQLVFTVRDTTDTNINIFSTTAVPINTWVHGVCVYDSVAQEAYVYYNSVLQGTVSVTDPIYTGATSFSIGNYTNEDTDSDPNGGVDDVTFFNRVLTQAEINTLYNANGNFEVDTGTLDLTITGPSDAQYSINDGSYDIGPFLGGATLLPVGTYTASPDAYTGYPAPTPLTSISITNGGTNNQAVTYTPYPTTEVYISSNGTGSGVSCSDPTNFSAVNQTELAPDATIYGCTDDILNEMLVADRDDLNFEAITIDGAEEITGAWETYDTNVYRKLVGTQNIDYIQATPPTSPSVGERWYVTRWQFELFNGVLSPKVSSMLARKWDGEAWIDDNDWFLQVERLWIDGAPVNKSRFPATGFINASSMDYESLTATELSGFGVDYFKNSTVNIKGQTWLFEDRIIETSSNTGDLTYEKNNSEVLLRQKLFYIDNIKDECNAHGDWAYDIDTGYLYVYLDSAPSNYTIEYAKVQHGIYSYGKNDIKANNVSITRTIDSPIKIWEGDTPSVTNSTISHYSCRGFMGYANSGIDIQGLDPWSYFSTDTNRLGNAENYDRKTNAIVNNNTIYDSENGSGISVHMMTGTGSVDGNKIYNIGYDPTRGVHEKSRLNAIELKATSGHTRDNNTIANISSTSILGVSTNGGTISDNITGNTCRNHRDVASIYSYGYSAKGEEVTGNIITDVISSDYDTFNIIVSAIYWDGGLYAAHNMQVHDNTLYNITGGQLYHLASNNTGRTPPNNWYDNTLYSDGGLSTYNSGTGINSVFTNNITLAESAYSTFDLTVKTKGGFWSVFVNGIEVQTASEGTATIPQGAYVISFQDDIEDEVIALTEDTNLNMSGVFDNPELLQSFLFE